MEGNRASFAYIRDWDYLLVQGSSDPPEKTPVVEVERGAVRVVRLLLNWHRQHAFTVLVKEVEQHQLVDR